MTPRECARAEVLAGAVALGEASDAERDAYRRHLAGCSRCIAVYGGEREIERVMRRVAEARDAECWEPEACAPTTARSHRRGRWTVGLATASAALVASLGVHALIAARVPVAVGPAAETADLQSAFHVTVERRAPAQPARGTGHAASSHALVVVHNVVTLDRPVESAHATLDAIARVRAKSSNGRHAGGFTAFDEAQVSAVGPSRPDERSIDALQTASTGAPPEEHAESIAVIPPTVVRDVMPLGGEDAIVPRPPAIAYDERAEGTTAVDVSVDERGIPVKCTIAKSSGWMVLDVAVCRAVMHARYSPRTMNGRAVDGVYHDAFTFRSNDADQ